MKDRVGAEHACRDPNPIIDGRKANVNLAYLGAKPRNNAQLSKSTVYFTNIYIVTHKHIWYKFVETKLVTHQVGVKRMSFSIVD